MRANRQGHGGLLAVIEDRVPNVDKGAGDPRSARIAQSLAACLPDHELLWLAASEYGAQEHTALLETVGFEVCVGGVHEELERRAGEITTVIVMRPHNWAAFHDAIDTFHPGATRVYDAESLFHLRVARQAQLVDGDRRAALVHAANQQYRVEVAAMQWADAVLCASSDAGELATRVNADAPVFVASHAVDVPAATRPLAARSGVAVFGGFLAGPGSPNEDAAIVAARDVAPYLPEPIAIAGAVPTPRVEALADDRVFVIGSVADPIDYLSRHRVHLCPLRFGAGIKLRCVDSAAAGTPLATTPVGAENLGLDHEMTRAMVGESPAELVTITRRLLADDVLWHAMSDSLRALAVDRYTPRTLHEVVRALVDTVEPSRVGFAEPARTA